VEDRVELSLLRAPNDPAPLSEEYQAGLEVVEHDLRKGGLKVTGLAWHPAGDTHLGQFLITLGPPVVAAVAAIAGGWVQARYGRRVRLKFDDIEAEARTPEEIETLLKRVAHYRETK
jgi:hypothetical protein